MRFLSRTILLLCSCCLLLSSCMTTFNKKTHYIRVATNKDTGKIWVDKEIFFLEDGEAKIEVERDKEPLVIQLQRGDSVPVANIKSRNSFNYLYDVILTAGIAAAVYKDNPRRYYYRKNIYLEQHNDTMITRRFAPVKKGTIYFSFGMPQTNYFYVKTTQGYKHKFGFLGYSAGIDYFYRNNSSLSTQLGIAIDNVVPFPAPIDYFGPHERTNVIYLDAKHNHVVNSFEFGYGFSFLWYQWTITDITNSNFLLEKMNSRGFGLSLASQYRVTKNMRVGILYQPTMVTYDNKSWKSDYMHFLSAELVFKFRLRKGR